MKLVPTRNMSDKLCREDGLSVVVPGKGSKGKSYAEYQAEKTGTSWKGKLKIAVNALVPQVSSFEELLSRLQAAGYVIKPGKYQKNCSQIQAFITVFLIFSLGSE